MRSEAFEFFLSLATFFVRNSSYHPGVYEIPSWLGVLDGVWEDREAGSEGNAPTGSLKFRVMIACGPTGAFPIIPEFCTNAIMAVAVRKTGNGESRIETWARRVGMSGTRKVASLAVVAALCLMLGNGLSASALPQAPAAGGQDAAGQAKQPYTMAEYNAYQAAKAETNPAQQVKLL